MDGHDSTAAHRAARSWARNALHAVGWVVLLLAAPLGPAMALSGEPCVGDCDGDERVMIAELTRCAVALVTAADPAPPCCDADGDAALAIGDLVVAVSKAMVGCAARCSGPGAVACTEGERCDVADSSCPWFVGGFEGSPIGVCRPVPAVCPGDHQPVCGCNGVTYPNDCERQRAGVWRQADGVCETFHCCPAGAFGTDVILVEFSPGISEQAVAKLVAALGASVSRHFEHIDVYVIAVPHGSELEMVARFNERPEVEVAYVNSIGCIPESWGCACCPPSERIICPNLPPCLPP